MDRVPPYNFSPQHCRYYCYLYNKKQITPGKNQPLKFFDVILAKLPESKACGEIGGLMGFNSFSKNFNCRIL